MGHVGLDVVLGKHCRAEDRCRRPLHLRRYLRCRPLFSAFLLTISLSLTGIVYAADPPPKSYKIPAQSVSTALKAFAAQSDLQLIFTEGDVGSAKTPGVTGTHAPREALSTILKGTGLEFEFTANNVVVVRKTVAAATAVDPDPPSDSSSKEGKKNSSGDFRVAQVDQAGAGNQVTGVSGQQDQSSALAEVVVVGRYEFLSADTSGTTNLPLPIERVPQSISLVSDDFIKAADLKTLGQIAEYTPGAINVGNQGNFGSLINLRGFTAGLATDGIPLQGYNSYEPDYAIYDRLEIVQGPTSVVYGVASPGGLVNFVTKNATAQTVDYVTAQVGSWNSFRLEAQVAGALDPDGNVRGIGVVVRDQGDSFMDFMNHDKTTLYGGINFDVNGSVSGYLHGGYERYERTGFDGIPTEAGGSPAPVPRSFFIGLEHSDLTTSIYHAEGDLSWNPTDALQFSLKGNYSRTNTTGIFPYSYGLEANGDLTLGTATYQQDINENYGIGASSIYHLDPIGLKDSFISLSALYQHNNLSYNLLEPPGVGAANIFDGEAAISEAFRALVTGPNFPYMQDTVAKTLTLSAQSVVQVIEPLSVLFGVSYSRPDVTQVSTGVAEQDFSLGSQISYRAGITYEFLPKTYAYVSYSQSFDPQQYFTVEHTVLPPITGDQYEGGVKYRSSNGRLLLTGALFEILEKNVAQYYTTIGTQEYFTPIGKVTHKGIELQAIGQITPEWQINAGYAYLRPEITNADASQAATIGQTELYLPKSTFSIYSTYTLSEGIFRGLSVGGGARYVSSEQTSYASAAANAELGLTSTQNIPDYTLVDASLGYAIDKWLIQLNGHNIFDKHYFINNYQTLSFGNFVGPPASFALSIRRQF